MNFPATVPRLPRCPPRTLPRRTVSLLSGHGSVARYPAGACTTHLRRFAGSYVRCCGGDAARKLGVAW